jgi:hypothetical protein
MNTLNKTSIFIVSAREDNLPFRICIETSGCALRRALITDLETGRILLGEFVFSVDYPSEPRDVKIKQQKRPFPDSELALIYEWAYEQSNRFDMLVDDEQESDVIYEGPFVIVSNWEALNTIWYAYNVLPHTKW